MLERSIRQGTLIAVCSLILIVLGTVASLRIPVQMIPDLEARYVSIITGWPGATPQDVEKEILVEQERYLRNLPQLQQITSFAVTGAGVVVLEFPFGTDINDVQIRISNSLNQVSNYPANVDKPRIIASSYSENAFMFLGIAPLEGNPHGLDMDMMLDFVEREVRPRLERVAGVSDVQVKGGGERQIQILVDEKKLVQRGLSLEDVRNVIRARNQDISAGDLDSGKRRYLLRTVGRFNTIQELDDLILRREGDSVVRLSDVALVHLDHFELRSLSFLNGERLISLDISREAGANVLKIKQAILPLIEQINHDLLEAQGLRMWLMSDNVGYVQDSIDNVWQNLFVGSLLATLSLFIFLRSWRPTLIGIIGTPICVIASFVGLLLFDRTINVISLAGIAFAIGMTFDNSIVVLESIDKAARRGLHKVDAAILGVREVWSAVLASTLTTVLVFAPILFVTVQAGQLYSDIAIAISASILASMLTSILIVPAASAWMGLTSRHVQLSEDKQTSKNWLVDCVAWLVATTTRQLSCLLIVFGLMLATAFWLTPRAEYLPEGEEPKVFANLLPPPGYNINEMSSIADEVNRKLMPEVNRDPADYDEGKAFLPPMKYYTLHISTERLLVIAEPVRVEDVEALAEGLRDWLRGFPGVRAASWQGSILPSINGGARSVNIDLYGNDLAALYKTTNDLYHRARKLFHPAAQVSSQPPSLTLDQPLIQIKPRWDRLSEVGFTMEGFGFTVAALSDGAFVDEFILDQQKIDMYLFSAQGYSQQPGQLARLPVMTPTGEVLPLETLAEIKQTVDSDKIRRLDSSRSVSLYIRPPKSIPLETAMKMIVEEMIPAADKAGEFRPGVRYEISGAADQMQETREALTGNFMVALVLCYLLLVAIFSHWGYPLIILTTVPLGIVGGIAGLALLNWLGPMMDLIGLKPFSQPFDMITMLGFLILLGTVVNNPILIVDRTRQNLAMNRGDVRSAVTDAVAARLRPIFMTTFTTVFGLAPLVLAPGAGSELYRGVGAVVLSGLICSTIVTITFLPCLLVLIFRIRQTFQRKPVKKQVSDEGSIAL